MRDHPQNGAGDRSRRGPAAVLAVQDIDAMIAACSRRSPSGQRNRALLAVMRHTGARVGTVLALRRSDLQLATGGRAGSITLRLSLKGGRAYTLPLHPWAEAEIRAWLGWRQIYAPRSLWLFCTISQPHPGGMLERRYVARMMTRAAKRAGIEGRVHPHALRASLAVELHDRGVPVAVIRDILGHSSIATTDSYLRRLGTSARDALLQIPNPLEEQP